MDRRSDFFAKYQPRDTAGRPKHAILHAALVAAIQDGYWKPGDRMPTELEFARLTPYSLGTVQRAIRALVADGFVTRRQRSGTFVAPAERRIGGPWIFRFLSTDETSFATMTTRVVSRRQVTPRTQWARWLTGGEDHRLLEVDRRIVADQRFRIFSRYYLDPARFPLIAAMPLGELHGANFAALIQSAYNLPVNRIARALQCTRIPRAVCRELGAPDESMGLVLEIAASAPRSRPVFYQQLFIPADCVKLFIGDTLEHWFETVATSDTAGTADTPQHAPSTASRRTLPARGRFQSGPTGSTG